MVNPLSTGTACTAVVNSSQSNQLTELAPPLQGWGVGLAHSASLRLSTEKYYSYVIVII